MRHPGVDSNLLHQYDDDRTDDVGRRGEGRPASQLNPGHEYAGISGAGHQHGTLTVNEPVTMVNRPIEEGRQQG